MKAHNIVLIGCLLSLVVLTASCTQKESEKNIESRKEQILTEEQTSLGTDQSEQEVSDIVDEDCRAIASSAEDYDAILKECMEAKQANPSEIQSER